MTPRAAPLRRKSPTRTDGTSKRSKRTAYLVAAAHGDEAPCVYAVLATSREAAIEVVQTLAVDGSHVEIVGRLSRDLVRRLKLKAGEVRTV